jgi:hypothetical protein
VEAGGVVQRAEIVRRHLHGAVAQAPAFLAAADLQQHAGGEVVRAQVVRLQLALPQQAVGGALGQRARAGLVAERVQRAGGEHQRREVVRARAVRALEQLGGARVLAARIAVARVVVPGVEQRRIEFERALEGAARAFGIAATERRCPCARCASARSGARSSARFAATVPSAITLRRRREAPLRLLRQRVGQAGVRLRVLRVQRDRAAEECPAPA